MNEADPDNNIFLVEKLLNRRWKKNRVEYLVKWLVILNISFDLFDVFIGWDIQTRRIPGNQRLISILV